MKKLFIIGTGPGDASYVTPQASAAIEASSELVAYGLYLELLGELCAGKTRHELPLGEEIERARLALNLAASGDFLAERRVEVRGQQRHGVDGGTYQ